MRYGLLFGPLAALIFFVGVATLALKIPNYSAVHQTVSEIGEVGSPARIPFTVMLCVVAACVLVFALALYASSLRENRSCWAAYLTGFMVISIVGVGVFAFPHPLHNIFGLSETIGYQAPLLLALAWRSNPRAKGLVLFSWAAFLLIWVAIGANLSVIWHGAIGIYVKPVIGLAQRLLFAAWFLWCAVTGALLFRIQQPVSWARFR